MNNVQEDLLGLLSVDETKNLLKTLYYKEGVAIKNASYSSSARKVADLANSKKAYNKGLELLSQMEDDTNHVDPSKQKALINIFQFMRSGLRNGIEKC